jgi:hypothetical protein
MRGSVVLWDRTLDAFLTDLPEARVPITLFGTQLDPLVDQAGVSL